MIVKCVITLGGTLEQCRMVKELPHMGEEVLRTLSTRRYAPVTFGGQPVAVEYVFYVTSASRRILTPSRAVDNV